VDESKKSSAHFTDFEKSILSKSVLDIGAGQDPVVAHAEVFDLAQGDANHITEFVKKQFDCVYSSHCLEHMRNPTEAIREWWQLIKPEGFLFFTVPDEDLYEQGVFPSRFNGDHKHTFTLAKKKSWSPVSINVLDFVTKLPDVEVVSIALNDIGYDRRFVKHGLFKTGYLFRTVTRLIGSLKKRRLNFFSEKAEAFFNRHSLVDQTRANALAQIEVILRKKPLVASI